MNFKRVAFILLYIINILYLSTGYRKGLKIDRMDTCGLSNNTPFRGNDFRIYFLENGISSIYSKSEVIRDIPKIVIELDVNRCANKESLDTCEHFTNLKLRDTCNVLLAPGVAWSPMINAFDPPIRCPMKKGIYTSKNATIDPNMVFLFPIDNWYWRLIVKVMDGKEYMKICLDLQSVKIR